MAYDLSYRNIFGEIEELQETANCYVINEPGDYCFPIVYGCGLKNSKDNPNSFTSKKKFGQIDYVNYENKLIKQPEIQNGYDCKIVSWDSNREFIQNLYLCGDYIKFTITNVPNSGANYIIAMLDKEDIIVWSWHIWLWKEKLENIQINEYELLNISLATKLDVYGNFKSWFYQWGRKDPINPNRIFIEEKGARSIGDSIKNPRLFFNKTSKRTSSPELRWLNSIALNMWNANCPNIITFEKTIYDPCPRGYRVPTKKVLDHGVNTMDIYEKNLLINKSFKLQILDEITECGNLDKYTTHAHYWTSDCFDDCDALCIYSEIYKVPFPDNGYGCGIIKSWSKYYGLPIRPQKENS